jgi:hypothetical protein
MLQIKNRWMAGTALIALPTMFLIGCSGGSNGSGGITSPTLLPTITPIPTGTPFGTPGPTSTPTGSPAPTVTPAPTRTASPTATPTIPVAGQSFALNATFSKINAVNIPALFRSTSGEGSFKRDTFGFFGATLKKTDNAQRIVTFVLSRNTKFSAGDSIALTGDLFSTGDLHRLQYFDNTTTRQFIAQSGTLNILKITPVTNSAGRTLTKVQFSITNANMVPVVPEGSGETFTINGAGETTSPEPTG